VFWLGHVVHNAPSRAAQSTQHQGAPNPHHSPGFQTAWSLELHTVPSSAAKGSTPGCPSPCIPHPTAYSALRATTMHAHAKHACLPAPDVTPDLMSVRDGQPVYPWGLRRRTGCAGSTTRLTSSECAALPGGLLKSPATSIGMSALAAIFSRPLSSVCT
jgi:hypothetical protein